MRRRPRAVPAGAALELPEHLRTLAAFKLWLDEHPHERILGQPRGDRVVYRRHLSAWAHERGYVDQHDVRRPDWARVQAALDSWEQSTSHVHSQAASREVLWARR